MDYTNLEDDIQQYIKSIPEQTDNTQLILLYKKWLLECKIENIVAINTKLKEYFLGINQRVCVNSKYFSSRDNVHIIHMLLKYIVTQNTTRIDAILSLGIQLNNGCTCCNILLDMKCSINVLRMLRTHRLNTKLHYTKNHDDNQNILAYRHLSLLELSQETMFDTYIFNREEIITNKIKDSYSLYSNIYYIIRYNNMICNEIPNTIHSNQPVGTMIHYCTDPTIINNMYAAYNDDRRALQCVTSPLQHVLYYCSEYVPYVHNIISTHIKNGCDPNELILSPRDVEYIEDIDIYIVFWSTFELAVYNRTIEGALELLEGGFDLHIFALQCMNNNRFMLSNIYNDHIHEHNMTVYDNRVSMYDALLWIDIIIRHANPSDIISFFYYKSYVHFLFMKMEYSVRNIIWESAYALYKKYTDVRVNDKYICQSIQKHNDSGTTIEQLPLEVLLYIYNYIDESNITFNVLPYVSRTIRHSILSYKHLNLADTQLNVLSTLSRTLLIRYTMNCIYTNITEVTLPRVILNSQLELILPRLTIVAPNIKKMTCAINAHNIYQSEDSIELLDVDHIYLILSNFPNLYELDVSFTVGNCTFKQKEFDRPQTLKYHNKISRLIIRTPIGFILDNDELNRILTYCPNVVYVNLRFGIYSHYMNKIYIESSIKCIDLTNGYMINKAVIKRIETECANLECIILTNCMNNNNYFLNMDKILTQDNYNLRNLNWYEKIHNIDACMDWMLMVEKGIRIICDRMEMSVNEDKLTANRLKYMSTFTEEYLCDIKVSNIKKIKDVFYEKTYRNNIRTDEINKYHIIVDSNRYSTIDEQLQQYVTSFNLDEYATLIDRIFNNNYQSTLQ